MADVFYVHWNEDEAREHAAAMTAAGHSVRVHATPGQRMTVGERLPDAVVISLERLPSHGRAIAEWFQEAKKRRSVPLVFVGGAADKVETTRGRFPGAVFCDRGRLVETLGTAITEACRRERRHGEPEARSTAS